MAWWFRQKLYTQIFIGMALGVLLGVIFKEHVAVIKPAGDVFIRLLKMMVVPLTFFTLVAGLTKLDGIKSLRSLGGLTVLIYATFALIATAVGLGLALLVQPGKGMVLPSGAAAPSPAAEFRFLDSLVQWVPDNPIAAFASGDLLQVIFFAVVVGIALLAAGKKAERLTALVQEAADLMIRITEFIMKVAPYGILALVANITASLKPEMLGEVGKFVLAQQLALLVLMVVFYPLAIRFVARLSAWRYYRNVSPAMLVAASTTSSAATLPVSMGVAQDNLGIPENVWGFMLSLGATIGKEGMASCLGVIAVFAYNFYGLEITPGLVMRFLMLGTILSLCTAGTKGGGIVTSAVLLQALDVPTAVIIPILASIWPILDIGNTCCNVTGDLCATTVLASRLGVLNRGVFDGRAKPANNASSNSALDEPADECTLEEIA
jgi:Na+/H+-dicarboxylate symporter